MPTTALRKNTDLASSPSKLRDYFTLTKPEVNLLVIMTTSAAYYLASADGFNWLQLFHCVLGTLLVASGTATLNQYMERRYDSDMRRTASRPLPSGRVSPKEALLFGISLSVAGGIYLWFANNPLTSILAVSTLLSYLLIYTPLKRKTALCTLLGAVPGAMPTLIGWAAGAGHLNSQAWLLFAVLFLWQFPHFLAIALMYREDYERAGFHMLPRFDLDSQFTRAEIVGFTVALILTTLAPAVGSAYFVGMLLAGIFFLYYGMKLAQSSSRAAASKLVHASVIYLPVVLGIMMASKR
jgi:protoheme IX farnesyltransferase